MSIQTNNRTLIYASLLTPTHPGAGRAIGVVDLPIVKDPLGYPYVPASEVKGALKSLLARRLNLELVNGRIKCGLGRDASILCCLLGGEVGEGPEGASALSITSLNILLVPAPNPDRGVVYVTTPSLLARAAEFLRASGDIKGAESLERAAGGIGDKALLSFEPPHGYVAIALQRVSAQRNDDVCEAGRVIESRVRGLNSLYRALPIGDRLVVLPEGIGKALIDKLLLRHTRVRLDRATKTVSRGALWTEEYLPVATLLMGLLVETGFKNKFCGDRLAGLRDLKDLLRKAGILDGEGFMYITVGGKESIGAGLMKLLILEGRGGSND